jgi:FixJ family two-component response regulator
LSDGVLHLIDDDEHVRRALTFLLGTAGFALRVYDMATAFPEKYDGESADCVVSDVRKPGLDGLKLLIKLKESGARVPAINMTGHVDVALAVKAMKAGAIDLIGKPFPDGMLLSAIHVALARHDGIQPPGDAEQGKAKLASLIPAREGSSGWTYGGQSQQDHCPRSGPQSSDCRSSPRQGDDQDRGVESVGAGPHDSGVVRRFDPSNCKAGINDTVDLAGRLQGARRGRHQFVRHAFNADVRDRFSELDLAPFRAQPFLKHVLRQDA